MIVPPYFVLYKFNNLSEKPQLISTCHLSSLKKNSTQEVKWLNPEDYKIYLQGAFLNYKTIYDNIGPRFGKILVKKQAKNIIDILQKIDPQIEEL
ncbi:unnamed protein product, partial [marine sediment metagenome]